MKECEIFSLCILIQFFHGYSSMECPKEKKCSCDNVSNTIELKCPPPDNVQIILKALPGKKVIIECRKNAYGIFPNIFPDLEIGDLTNFIYKDCLLPNEGFSSALKKFNINKIEFMKLIDMRNTTNNMVTNELFSGLSTMERLHIIYSENVRLEDNFLENLPNLKHLTLQSIYMRHVSKHMFQYTPNLDDLKLSQNIISFVSNEIFKNLSKLRRLSLDDNKLITLNRHIFTGLRNLKILNLSSNKIMFIDEDTFAEMTDLVDLRLKSNNILVIVSNIFRHNIALKRVDISKNPNLNLSDYVFANFTNLGDIIIDESNLEVLPQHIFEGSNNIRSISMEKNNIKELSENIFKGLVNLKTLKLEGNKIAILPNAIFSTLTNLEELYLGGNNLTEINEYLFKNTCNLSCLDLKKNKIATIHLNASINLRKLINLNLSYNQYDGNRMDNFINCEELREINLSYNLIDKFPNRVNTRKKRKITLNLDNNRIKHLRVTSLINFSEVQLNNNNISVLDFTDVDETLRKINPNISTTILYMSNNPIVCNCSNFYFIRYINDHPNRTVNKMVRIEMAGLYCFAPEAYKDTEIKNLQSHQITCPLDDEGCPKQCTCDFRPYDSCAVINCSYRNLTNTPMINVTNGKFKQIEVNLEGNKLESAPDEQLGYDNVTRLFLSNNNIADLNWIPPEIQVLKLDGNLLRFIDSKVLHSLNQSTTLENLTLHGNPWNCDCSTAGLKTYLQNHITKVNVRDVRCEDNNLLVNKTNTCIHHFIIALVIAAPILIVLIAIAMVANIYFYYQETIKAWLYANNLCLSFVTEEELDKAKPYDVFISYSYKDEEFVVQNLLPVLEARPHPFKICIHIRDWVPGEFIATQINNSVLDSKRTLVILSDNFLESVWGKMEFRTAHTQAINEGRVRVVVVKYGPLNEEKLDNELKTYLKTNTYLEWGEPWFWIKLKYALRSRRIKTNDDEFEMVMPSPTTQDVHKSDLTTGISAI